MIVDRIEKLREDYVADLAKARVVTGERRIGLESSAVAV